MLTLHLLNIKQVTYEIHRQFTAAYQGFSGTDDLKKHEIFLHSLIFCL